MNMKEGFPELLTQAIGGARAEMVLKALKGESSVSVRVNPSKSVNTELFEREGKEVVPWNAHGFMLGTRPDFTLDPLFHAGAYYVQDSSAMFVGYVLRSLLPGSLDRPYRVLDLCAAPGGKATDVAASLRERYGENFLLVTNETLRARAATLAMNMETWGEGNVCVSSVDPKAFGQLNGFFDLILADVPCSGEGMFRKDARAGSQWSRDTVALCASRQRRIVADVWPALSEGGLLLYSTCTFNEQENDRNVDWVMGNLGAEKVSIPVDEGWGLIETGNGYLLAPGFVRGEGQYCAALRKVAPSGGVRLRGPAKSVKGSGLEKLFSTEVNILRKGEMYFALPKAIAAEVASLEGLGLLSSGTAIGAVKGRDLVPAGALALAVGLRREAFHFVDLKKEMALKYLHGDALAASSLGDDLSNGLVIFGYGTLALGFVRNMGTRCNNLLPKGRRIRMDINV